MKILAPVLAIALLGRSAAQPGAQSFGLGPMTFSTGGPNLKRETQDNSKSSVFKRDTDAAPLRKNEDLRPGLDQRNYPRQNQGLNPPSPQGQFLNTGLTYPRQNQGLNPPSPQGHVLNTGLTYPRQNQGLNPPSPQGQFLNTGLTYPRQIQRSNPPSPQGQVLNTGLTYPGQIQGLNPPHLQNQGSNLPSPQGQDLYPRLNPTSGRIQNQGSPGQSTNGGQNSPYYQGAIPLQNQGSHLQPGQSTNGPYEQSNWTENPIYKDPSSKKKFQPRGPSPVEESRRLLDLPVQGRLVKAKGLQQLPPRNIITAAEGHFPRVETQKKEEKRLELPASPFLVPAVVAGVKQ